MNSASDNLLQLREAVLELNDYLSEISDIQAGKTADILIDVNKDYAELYERQIQEYRQGEYEIDMCSYRNKVLDDLIEFGASNKVKIRNQEFTLPDKLKNLGISIPSELHPKEAQQTVCVIERELELAQLEVYMELYNEDRQNGPLARALSSLCNFGSVWVQRAEETNSSSSSPDDYDFE